MKKTKTQREREKKKKKPPSVKGKRKERRWRNQTHWTQWREKKNFQKLRLTRLPLSQKKKVAANFDRET